MKNSRWILPGLFIALGPLYVFQARQILKDAGTPDPSSGRLVGAMQARVNGISLAIVPYLESHDPEMFERIRSEGAEVNRLLGEIRDETAQKGSAVSFAQVDKACESMQQALAELLKEDQGLRKEQETLNAAGEALMSVMVARVEPSIKPGRLNSSSRLQAVLAAAAEAKSVTKNPQNAAPLVASQKRFHQAMEKYLESSGNRRAQLWATEAAALFDQCIGFAQNVQRAEERKQADLERYMQKQSVFNIVLQENCVSQAQSIRFCSISQLFAPGLISVLAGGMLLLFGFVFCLRTAKGGSHASPPALRNILRCVEAAAAGDVSRVPEAGASDEAGQLAQAVSRLINVLARSESLVYHLAALVESSGEAIISHTLEGVILSWNKGAQRIYGYSADEMKGQSIFLLAPEAEAETENYLQRLRRGERFQPFEVAHRARSGRPVGVLVRVSAIFDSTHKIIGASFCAQDLTGADLRALKAIEEPGRYS